MYIQSFHMDGFGIFSDVSVENLSPGLSIFLGENEAGKSTCLEFLRTMLIGYPDPRNKEYKRIPGPLRGGQPGGRGPGAPGPQGEPHAEQQAARDLGAVNGRHKENPVHLDPSEGNHV